MNFWDRLLFLGLSVMVLFFGAGMVYALWEVRSIHPKMILTEQMATSIDLMKYAALPTIIVAIGMGLCCFYLALREEK